MMENRSGLIVQGDLTRRQARTLSASKGPKLNVAAQAKGKPFRLADFFSTLLKRVRVLFLAKLALLLSQDIADTDRVLDRIRDAANNLEP